MADISVGTKQIKFSELNKFIHEYLLGLNEYRWENNGWKSVYDPAIDCPNDKEIENIITDEKYNINFEYLKNNICLENDCLC